MNPQNDACPPHEHNFVPPSNDDAQQCDTYCREHWHRCSICGLSREQIKKQSPAPAPQPTYLGTSGNVLIFSDNPAAAPAPRCPKCGSLERNTFLLHCYKISNQIMHLSADPWHFAAPAPQKEKEPQK